MKHLFSRLSPAQKIILSFLLVIFCGSLLLSLPWVQTASSQAGYLDHLFTAVSMVCVTGLFTRSVVDTYNVWGQLLCMLLIQIGGLGILTFIGFFIFIGNLKHIPAVSSLLSSMITGHEVIVSVLASQVISNVPAAILLSGFTEKGVSLLIGTNLGGLGTLIASMASLISYKYIVRSCPEKKGIYFRWFTIANAGFLAVLMAVYFLVFYSI